ncbi:MAG: hypothetical protein JWO19_1101 [Bryobacterales bacterium]|nr:hypothetical protein [Bryobacterales bacterium]
MRRVSIGVLMWLGVAGLASSQALTEAAGAIAGGSVGGVAGKRVSDGISNVFGKVDTVTAKAAKTGKAPVTTLPKPAGNPAAGTVLQVGPSSVVKDHSLVPPPPPIRRAALVVPPPPPPAPSPAAIHQPIPVLPPPPQVTAEDLKTIASGTPRGDVLKLGSPASRITMYDDGHLVEIYRYQSRDTTFGVVRLSDGSVSSVQVR